MFTLTPFEKAKVKSDSVRAYQKYEISRYELINQITKERCIKYRYSKALDTYCLDFITSSFAKKLAKESEGKIIEEAVFHIIWKTSRGKILAETDTKAMYCLSYRKAKPEYNLPAYVMIWKKVGN